MTRRFFKLRKRNFPSTRGPSYLFYRHQGSTSVRPMSLPLGYSIAMWWPSRRHPWPDGLDSARSRARFAFRYALDCLHSFSNREVGAVCIYYGDRLVHYSGFTPRYWRFPFLSDDDLQIGDTWTCPAHRGKGLAGYALDEILNMKQKGGRGMWYVVGDNNPASIRVVERAAFELMGVGHWHRPWGIKLLGSYVLDPIATNAAERAVAADAPSEADSFGLGASLILSNATAAGSER